MAATSAQPANVGFDFSNYARNEFLGAKLGGQPRGESTMSMLLLTTATSTGTTIVGLRFGGGDTGDEEGICLGADTRATGGAIVADKNCEKVRTRRVVAVQRTRLQCLKGARLTLDPLSHREHSVLRSRHCCGH